MNQQNAAALPPRECASQSCFRVGKLLAGSSLGLLFEAQLCLILLSLIPIRPPVANELVCQASIGHYNISTTRTTLFECDIF